MKAIPHWTRAEYMKKKLPNLNDNWLEFRWRNPLTGKIPKSVWAIKMTFGAKTKEKVESFYHQNHFPSINTSYISSSTRKIRSRFEFVISARRETASLRSALISRCWKTFSDEKSARFCVAKAKSWKIATSK